MSQRFAIIGLGNPGSKYDQTRHNAGFWFVGRLLEKFGGQFRPQKKLSAQLASACIAGSDVVLVQPTTFMNESGRAVRAVTDYYQIPAKRMLVAYDELDLSPGTIRLKQGGGHGGHNGMRDIFRHLDNTNFLRLRIGIGHPGHKDRVTPHVLGRPTSTEELAIRESIEQGVGILSEVLDGNLEAAMKALHTK